ncbi:MAG: type II toxin-antitoxin system HicB family antitoxin [Planctomycetota bacterium]
MADEVGKVYTVSDGELVLQLEEAGDGSYCVTAPFEQGLVTQAKTIEEAFEMAYDAREALNEARLMLADKAREITKQAAKVSKAS